MKINSFKDLDCWKKARELVNFIYCLTKEGNFSKDYGLKDQIQRASVSIMANIAEGFGGKSDVEYVRFLGFAIRSGYEVQSHLCVAKDVEYISEYELKAGEEIAEACISMCKAFVKYLNSSSQR